jgi:hypothetical protein
MAPKYVFESELGALYETGLSVILYQHFPRVQRVPFCTSLTARIAEVCAQSAPFSVTTPHVAFVVIPQPEHVRVLRTNAATLAARDSHAGFRLLGL